MTTSQRERAEILEIAEALAGEFGSRADELDRSGRFAPEFYDRAHEAGFMRLTLPREYGGWGTDPLTFCLAQEKLAQGCAGTALAICMHLSIQANLSFMSNPVQRDALFGDAVAKRTCFAGGGTEMESGGSWNAAGASARRIDGGYVLNARKRFCSGAQRADWFYSFLGVHETDGSELMAEVSAFLVPRETPGARVDATWDSMGMRASGSDDLVYEDCRVPESALVGRPGRGFSQAARWLYWFLLGESATYLGVAEGALETAASHVREKQRKHAGTKLAPGYDRQLSLGEASAWLAAARALLHREAQTYATPEAMRRGYTNASMARAAMAKFSATRAAAAATDCALAIAGGFGYLRGSGFERHYRDVRAGPFHPPRNAPTALALAGRHRLGLDLDPASAQPFRAGQSA